MHKIHFIIIVVRHPLLRLVVKNRNKNASKSLCLLWFGTNRKLPLKLRVTHPFAKWNGPSFVCGTLYAFRTHAQHLTNYNSFEFYCFSLEKVSSR